MLRSRFQKNVAEQRSQTIAKMDFANIISRGIKCKKCINHTFWLSRVCVSESRDCRFFLVSKLNKRILIDAVRSAYVLRLIVYKLRYQTFRFYFRFSEYAIAIIIAILYYRNFVNLFFRVIWHVSAVCKCCMWKAQEEKRKRTDEKSHLWSRIGKFWTFILI